MATSSLPHARVVELDRRSLASAVSSDTRNRRRPTGGTATCTGSVLTPGWPGPTSGSGPPGPGDRRRPCLLPAAWRRPAPTAALLGPHGSRSHEKPPRRAVPEGAPGTPPAAPSACSVASDRAGPVRLAGRSAAGRPSRPRPLSGQAAPFRSRPPHRKGGRLLAHPALGQGQQQNAVGGTAWANRPAGH